jgi:hypothetical protein
VWLTDSELKSEGRRFDPTPGHHSYRRSDTRAEGQVTREHPLTGRAYGAKVVTVAPLQRLCGQLVVNCGTSPLSEQVRAVRGALLKSAGDEGRGARCRFRMAPRPSSLRRRMARTRRVPMMKAGSGL